ncbi:hypothetical protein GCM10022380_54820 [Amycolatopsis tucumanensis]|uniref:Uncharacterized protein n=1 Tax=Amycolatopsis tucumanensis TaxID=401106 RepID=A0ABP7IYA7_9PSEU
MWETPSPVRVGLVRDHTIGSASRSAWSDSGDRDAVEQSQWLWVVAGVAAGEQHPHRQPAAIDGEVDCGAQSSAGASESFPVDRERLDGGGAAPFFRAPADATERRCVASTESR